MKDKSSIEGFYQWKIPSEDDTIYFEGMPTAEDLRRDKERAEARRREWQPSETALLILRELKYLEGKSIIIELWDNFMTMLPDEGPPPFSCDLIEVFTEDVQDGDRAFTQLFVVFKNPVVIENGNQGGHPIYESCFDPASGTYTYNCESFYRVSEA